MDKATRQKIMMVIHSIDDGMIRMAGLGAGSEASSLMRTSSNECDQDTGSSQKLRHIMHESIEEVASRAHIANRKELRRCLEDYFLRRVPYSKMTAKISSRTFSVYKTYVIEDVEPKLKNAGLLDKK